MSIDRIYIDANDREKYEMLKNESINFKDFSTKELFLIALTYGIKYGQPEKLTKKDGFIRTEYLKDEDWAIFKAVAIYYESFEVLDNLDTVLEIVESYAHAGIVLLERDIKGSEFGSFEKRYELDLMSKLI